MSDERKPCANCGRPTLSASLRATGGYCRQCRPGSPAPSTSSSPATGPTWASAERTGQLVPVFIPALVVTLFNIEKQKGVALTETEVVEIRDRAPVIMLDAQQAAQFYAARDYPDIDPENVWAAWQTARAELTK